MIVLSGNSLSQGQGSTKLAAHRSYEFPLKPFVSYGKTFISKLIVLCSCQQKDSFSYGKSSFSLWCRIHYLTLQDMNLKANDRQHLLSLILSFYGTVLSCFICLKPVENQGQTSREGKKWDNSLPYLLLQLTYVLVIIFMFFDLVHFLSVVIFETEKFPTFSPESIFAFHYSYHLTFFQC